MESTPSRHPYAAVIDQVGRVLGTEQFPADAAGYAAPVDWMRRFGQVGPVGVEGTGAYAGLAACCATRASMSSRSTGPTARPAGSRASPISIDAIQAAKTALAYERTELWAA